MRAMLMDASMLMLIGMLAVFAFLVLLTYCVELLTRFTADPATPVAPSAKLMSQPNLSISSKAQMAAIAAAVAKYRASRTSS